MTKGEVARLVAEALMQCAEVDQALALEPGYQGIREAVALGGSLVRVVLTDGSAFLLEVFQPPPSRVER